MFFNIWSRPAELTRNSLPNPHLKAHPVSLGAAFKSRLNWRSNSLFLSSSGCRLFTSAHRGVTNLVRSVSWQFGRHDAYLRPLYLVNPSKTKTVLES